MSVALCSNKILLGWGEGLGKWERDESNSHSSFKFPVSLNVSIMVNQVVNPKLIRNVFLSFTMCFKVIFLSAWPWHKQLLLQVARFGVIGKHTQLNYLETYFENVFNITKIVYIIIWPQKCSNIIILLSAFSKWQYSVFSGKYESENKVNIQT